MGVYSFKIFLQISLIISIYKDLTFLVTFDVEKAERGIKKQKEENLFYIPLLM